MPHVNPYWRQCFSEPNKPMSRFEFWMGGGLVLSLLELSFLKLSSVRKPSF